MKVFVKNIKTELEKIERDIVLLLEKYSNLENANPSGTIMPVISTSGDYFFKRLNGEGEQLQRKVFKSFTNISKLIEELISDYPPTVISRYNENKEVILKLIIQDGLVWKSEVQKVKEYFLGINNLLSNIFTSDEGEILIIPDTNALYFNTDIESWSFDGINKFILILMPAVVSELDKHKVLHRAESIRDKAKKLIRKIKEYRRRGNLLNGVPIVKNKIALRSIALEPDFSKTSIDLDKENDDDKIIASFLNLAKSNSTEAIYLVTNDLNLQTKAEFFHIPYLEPPKL